MRIRKMTTYDGIVRESMTVDTIYPEAASVTVFASAVEGPSVHVTIEGRGETEVTAYLTLEQADDLIAALQKAKRQAPGFFKSVNPPA